MTRRVTPQLIQRVIRRVRLAYGDLFGDNSGVFAIALCRWLCSERKRCRLILVGDSASGAYERATLYHVLAEVDGSYYDASGFIGSTEEVNQYIDEVVTRAVGDPHVYVHARKFGPKLAEEIRANTDYTASEDELYAAVLRAAAQRN